ncbi:MAG: CFI-box-CTERM domain-containing protein [Candidatus Hadarchaeales archaeon]
MLHRQSCLRDLRGKRDNILRYFRDAILLRTRSGRRFISLYYRLSPPLAGAIGRSNLLKLVTRCPLLPVLRLMRKTIRF